MKSFSRMLTFASGAGNSWCRFRPSRCTRDNFFQRRADESWFGAGGPGVKVVLFCGGLGLRIRDYSESIPKPLVPIGQRPMLWHVMKYYSHYGHKDFILGLGHQGEATKRFFLNMKSACPTILFFPKAARRCCFQI